MCIQVDTAYLTLFRQHSPGTTRDREQHPVQHGLSENITREPADKPGSVVDSHSSGPCVTAGLKRPTREPCGPHDRSPIWSCSGWGLPCHACCQARGALLPHHFTLTRALPKQLRAVYFLWHFPWTCALQELPGTLPCGARTFLPATAERLPGRLPAASISNPRSAPSADITSYVLTRHATCRTLPPV